MRAGLSTIQQTLTAEAASVLNHSIAEAARRNHGQATPLHVAATLLASPTGFLRQACIKSHPNSSHPLQCRALELCFSVALERLPTAQPPAASPPPEPSISNALMAALKRAQAHQRRGCPEQQQQPLLAVKVELEQLIISILDDPSVSRVMREASFSSPAVKATIEQTLTSTTASPAASTNSNNSGTNPPLGLGFRPGIPAMGRNLYLNPRLQQGVSGGGGSAQSGQMRGDEVKRVVEILARGRKRNPVLVGDSEPESVVREVLRRIEGRELGEGPLRSSKIVHLEKEKEMGEGGADRVARIKEVSARVEAWIGKSGVGGVVLNLGDLKWLVEQPAQQQVVSEAGRAAVAEIGRLVSVVGDGGGRIWLIGTATCETYLRCQVYHPSMENDWDLQAVPIAARTPVPGLFPRLGTNGILSSSVESMSPLKGFPPAKLGLPRRLSESSDQLSKARCCPQCQHSYEQELAKFVASESENSSPSVKSEGNQLSLPQWLQNAKARDAQTEVLVQSRERQMASKQKAEELQKKWSDTCLHLHPNFLRQHSFGSERITPVPTMISMPSLYNPKLLNRPSLQPKLQMNKSLGESLQLNTAPVQSQLVERTNSPPGSPVRTDLVLGQTKVSGTEIKDLIGRLSSEEVPVNNDKLIKAQRDVKLAAKLDADSFKRLSRGLAEKVWWQPEAAVSVAATMTECKLGNSKQRRLSKGDMWILFIGPDRVGKRKMASALADLVSGSSPVTISLGSRRSDSESEMGFRGKTVVDKIVEAVRRNPFSVIVLEDVNEADALVRGSVKRAMERGRLTDSHGREISLGNVVFILTADWLPEDLRHLSKGVPVDGEKLGRVARTAWQLRLSVSGKTAKRRAHWLDDDRSFSKPRKEVNLSLGFDLNKAAADGEDEKTDGSHNSSELTVDHEDECGIHLNRRPVLAAASPPPPREILDAVDDTIVFKQAESVALRNGIMSTVSNWYSNIVGKAVPLEMDEDALEKILSGLWLGKTSLEAWTEGVLVPSFEQLKAKLPVPVPGDSLIVRLEADGETDPSDAREDLLPSSVKVVAADA